MHIDKNSFGYKFFKEAAGTAAFVGGGSAAAISTMLVPWVTFEKKWRWVRPLMFIGCWGIGMAAGRVAEKEVVDYIDNITTVINEAKISVKIYKHEEENACEDEEDEQPEYGDYEELLDTQIEEEIGRVYEVFKVKNVLMFDDLDDAKTVGAYIYEIASKCGYTTVEDFVKVLNRVTPKKAEGIDGRFTSIIGWNKSDLTSDGAIDIRPFKMADKDYYHLTLPNIHFLSETVVVSVENYDGTIDISED